MADAGGGQTAIRVDAQVTWLPASEASEMVPAAATAVTLSEIPDPNQHQKPPQPETITSLAAVRRITAMVNSLPVFPPGPRECGFGTGADLVLTFLSAPKGRVLATALVNGGGCQPVILAAGATKITNDTQTWSATGVVTLGVPYHGHALAVTVLKTADSSKILGPDCPHTLAVGSPLAGALLAAGQAGEAVTCPSGSWAAGPARSDPIIAPPSRRRSAWAAPWPPQASPMMPPQCWPRPPAVASGPTVPGTPVPWRRPG